MFAVINVRHTAGLHHHVSFCVAKIVHSNPRCELLFIRILFTHIHLIGLIQIISWWVWMKQWYQPISLAADYCLRYIRLYSMQCTWLPCYHAAMYHLKLITYKQKAPPESVMTSVQMSRVILSWVAAVGVICMETPFIVKIATNSRWYGQFYKYSSFSSHALFD